MEKIEGTGAAVGKSRFASGSDDDVAGNAVTFDRWVAQCRGFQVEDADGRLGYVVDALRAADGRPRGLVVRVGLFRKHVVFVSTRDVKAVRPERRRVVVAPATAGRQRDRVLESRAESIR
jgi:PRC-barrel domain protein